MTGQTDKRLEWPPFDACPQQEIAGEPHVRLEPPGCATAVWCDRPLYELFAHTLRLGRIPDEPEELGVERSLAPIAAGAAQELGIIPATVSVPSLPAPSRSPTDRRTGPLVSVIIVNWNGARLLASCLDSLGQQTYDSMEILVVDNGSRDRSKEVARRYGKVRWIGLRRNTGFCHANNVGARHARGRYLFLLNNDTTVERDCIAHLVDELEASPGDVAGVFPKVLFDHCPRVINAFGSFWHRDSEWRDNRVGLLDLGGLDDKAGRDAFGSLFAAVMIRADVFARLGRFDRRMFSYGEDFDLSYRIRAAGLRFRLNPLARVYHKYRASSQDSVRPEFAEFHFLRNYLLLLGKNYEASTLWRRGPKAFRRYLVSYVAAGVRSRQWYRVRLGCRVLGSLLALFPHIMAERSRMGRFRVVSDDRILVRSEIPHYNVFFYEQTPVLSVLSLRIALGWEAEWVRPADSVR